jgi:purine-binding chemotaxis protein CheW
VSASAAPHSIANDLPVVVLRLGGEQYGVEIGKVQEIIRPQPVTTAPHAPPFVDCALNLRGRVIPVIDLRVKLGIGRREVTRDTRIAVAELADCTVGLVVDAASEVLRLDGASLDPPSPVVPGIESAFITRIEQLADRLNIVLDVGQILSGDKQRRVSAL